jgi:hypothetical protein
MFRLSHHKNKTAYWLKVFALYALVEACIQLLLYFTINYFGTRRTSIPEYHLVMLLFQCVLILPIWGVAWLVRKQTIAVQVIINIAFYILYTYVWFNPVQDAIAFVYNHFQQLTRPVYDRQTAHLDRGGEAAFLNYQLLKHAFRLSWFYLASFFYNYRTEENERLKLALSNKELQLRLLKGRLNPSFYFTAINHLQAVAQIKPGHATAPILQLAKMMEYAIYEAKEKKNDLEKELNFLANYIHFLNQQHNGAKIRLDITGGYNGLTIIPMLLTSIVDTINGSGKGKQFDCNLSFENKNLLFAISETGSGELFKGYQEILTEKMDELCPGKYLLKMADDKNLILKIELDEA